MKEERYFYVPQASVQNELPEEEAAHAVRVLRMREGNEMMLMDGEGVFYRAKVTDITGKHCHYSIEATLPQKPAWSGHLHLAIAPTKMMERMEWLVEKATEVGFDELTLLDCQYSERRVVKTPRLEKIVVSAMKQSRKAWKPVVNEMQDFNTFIANHNKGFRYIAHCYEEIPRVSLFNELRKAAAGGLQSEEVLVLIGPEGDFSEKEVRLSEKAGYLSVDLGQSRLRTETAGLAAVMMMQLSQL